MTTRRAASAVLVLVLLGWVIAGCSSDSDGGGAATTTTAPGGSTSPGDATGPAARRTSHVVVVGYDGLDQARVSSQEGDLFALLASRGAAGTIEAPAAGAESCTEAWAQAVREGGEATGANVLDTVAEGDDGVDIGVFTTSSDLAEVLVPETEATTAVGASDVPGLDPWPSEKLAVEATKTEAIRHVSEVEGDSVTLLHSDLLVKAAEDPDAANLAPIATKTADDLVDLLISAADARSTRPDEDWLFVVAGGCSAGGTSPLIVEGDRVDEPRDLGDVALPPATIGTLTATYLGVDAEGWPELPADLITARGEK